MSDVSALVSQAVMLTYECSGFQVARLIPTLAPQWVIEGTPKEAPRRCH
jgi:hypothetical protein